MKEMDMNTATVIVLIWLGMALFAAIVKMVQKMPQDPANSLFVAPFVYLGMLLSGIGVVSDRVIRYIKNRLKRD